MKILVTGGAGFIGSNMVRRLVRDGHRVTVLDSLLSGLRSNLDPFPQVEFIEGDVRDADAVERAVAGSEVVFHLAASVGTPRSIDFPVDDAEINVIGTIRVLEASRRAGVRKVVTASSASVYGELMTLPIGEEHPVEPDSPYAATKLCQEKLCLAWSRLYPLDCVCLRYFNVFGPNQRVDAYGNVVPIFAFAMLRGEPLIVFGDGEQTRDFVHVYDVVEANLRAATTEGLSGAFNLGSGTQTSVNGLIDMMREVSGIDPEVVFEPPRPGDVLDSLADVSRARQAFGFEPCMSLSDGLAQYFSWATAELER